MSGKFNVREGLRAADIPMIAELLREVTLSTDSAFDGNAAGDEYFRTKYDPDRVRDWMEDIVFTAWTDDDLAGFGRARKDGFITHVFVRKEYRNLGLGSRILGILEETLGSAGNGWLFLDADPGTIGFYERNDWTRRESGTIGNHGLLLVPMEKELY
ncbi:MAG: GNAT family N-acetyltransferase [Candidatus Moranbacteria bacterium]|nr:GNAT family N-acetyltransferase [Candidatus Moranbacteria bacterium]